MDNTVLDYLLDNSSEVARYIQFFDKSYKLACIQILDFFAESLIDDTDAEIRIACALKSEFDALQLLNDKD